MASRMVKDYTTDFYEPAAVRADAMTVDTAKSLAGWKKRVRTDWSGVRIRDIDFQGPEVADVGAAHSVSISVDLGSLAATDVRVELIHGIVGLNDELAETHVVPMAATAGGTFAGEWTSARAGRNGFTVRVVPSHPQLRSWAEVGVATWA